MQCWAAAQNICSSPHPADFLCHRSPASHGFAKLCWTGARLLFNFCASSRHKLPTLGTFSPFFASGVNSRCKKSTFCLDRRGKGLDSGGKTCKYNRMNKATRLFTKKISCPRANQNANARPNGNNLSIGVMLTRSVSDFGCE